MKFIWHPLLKVMFSGVHFWTQTNLESWLHHLLPIHCAQESLSLDSLIPKMRNITQVTDLLQELKKMVN